MDKGLKILIDTYWNITGWKNSKISKENFYIAKKEGYMFDYPKVKTHQESLSELKNIISKINYEDIVNAFLFSLSTRKLEYRSALASYWYAIAIPEHKSTNENHCNICGWYKWEEKPNEYEVNLGLNVLNFERYKFGGVRYDHLNYSIFDLEQFLKLPKVSYTKEDINILNNILNVVNRLESSDKVGKYRDLLLKEKLLKTNKNEISNLLNILGICGVLSSKEIPCYQEKFVEMFERAPVEYKNDFSYPVNRWYARDGVNKDRFYKTFHFKMK